MSEVVLPEPYYHGNIRTATDGRPKTVPASIGSNRNEGNLYRPASGCKRLDEMVSQTSNPTTPKVGVYRLPASHRTLKPKGKRPSSPLEVVSEQPGIPSVRVLKSKGSIVAEVSYDGSGVEAKQKPTASGILRKEMEEDLELDDGQPENEFKKIARLKSSPPKSSEQQSRPADLTDIQAMVALQAQVKIKEAELAVKERVIAQMQQQVDDFQLQLGEERLSHNDTKKAYEERLVQLRLKKDQERADAIKALTTKYETKIEEINTTHRDLVDEMKSTHGRIQKKLEDQVEHLTNAFDEFRVSFTSEMELKWKRREEEIRKRIQEEADGRWQQIVNRNNEQHTEEIAKMKKKQAEEMEVVKHEHESEVNSLLRKYKDAYSLSEKVGRQQQLIEGLHERLREFEHKVEETTHQLADKTREAAELTMRLTSMERDFSTKLQQNADMWQRRLEGYIAENADIKRLYAFSVHRQSCDKLERDIEMRDRSRNAAQLANAVLQSRIRTGLPLIPSNPPTEDEERRVRQAQVLRQRAAKLGAQAIVDANNLLGDHVDPNAPVFISGNKPTTAEERVMAAEAEKAKREKLKQDLFAVTAGRPMSAPTTEVENFYVFMAAAATLNNPNATPRADSNNSTGPTEQQAPPQTAPANGASSAKGRKTTKS